MTEDSSQNPVSNLLKWPSKPGQMVSDRLELILTRISKKDLAHKSGLSERTLSKILTGHASRAVTLGAIAKAAGVVPEWLIHGTGPVLRENVLPTVAELPKIPVSVGEFAIANPIALSRLGAAIRIAEGIVSGPTTAQQWALRAKLVVEIYNELTAQAAADNPAGDGL